MNKQELLACIPSMSADSFVQSIRFEIPDEALFSARSGEWEKFVQELTEVSKHYGCTLAQSRDHLRCVTSITVQKVLGENEELSRRTTCDVDVPLFDIPALLDYKHAMASGGTVFHEGKHWNVVAVRDALFAMTFTLRLAERSY